MMSLCTVPGNSTEGDKIIVQYCILEATDYSELSRNKLVSLYVIDFW